MTALVLSAWSAVSPYGVGSEAFRAGITARRTAVGSLDPATHPGPFATGGVVPDFSTRTHVGVKGTRTMDRVTAIAVATVGRLIADCQDQLSERPEEMGLVLGTGSGSVQSIMDFTKGSLTGKRPYHVEAARFPNSVMNRAAGQCAIWHGIKGPNTTVAGGALTGLLALSYALRLHRGGHCTRVMCGAAEEFTPQRAWLEWHSRAAWDDCAAPAHSQRSPTRHTHTEHTHTEHTHTAEGGDRAAPLGEGGAVFLLETAQDAAAGGRSTLARLMTTRFLGFHEPTEARRALADCIRQAMATARVRATDVRLVAPGQAGGEEEAIRDALGVPDPADPADPERVEWLRVGPLLGDTSAAATSLQLAAVLAVAGTHGLAPGEVALVTGIERDGMVGCALLGGDWPWPPPPGAPATHEE